MSEKIYGYLLRLDPSQFRDRYGDEALQLFRDRAHHERGLFPQLRLWCDLLVDLAASVPREYFHIQPELLRVSALQSAESVPGFYILTSKAPHPGALLFGTALSLLALFTFSFLLDWSGHHARLEAFGSTQTQEESSFSQPGMSPNVPRDETSAAQSRGNPSLLDAGERRRVVGAASTILRKHYIDRDSAKKMADALLAHEKRGDDDAVTDGAAFADLLTRQMRDVKPDRHLTLDYSQDPFPQFPAEPTPEDLGRFRERLKQQNCAFEKVQVFPHNIGYLKLNWFPDVSVCEPTAANAMASLNHTDAIIFDLRDNRGGEPAMVALIAAYLFDHPEYWYNPRENTTEESWTHSPVPGNRLADKPVYVLTSPTTFSGAEQFCYDLKMLKRATLVGEKTGGGAHSGVWHRIDDHFGMGVPETKALNPFSKTDWAEIGVEPNVKVKAADALQTAVELAENKVQRR